MFMDVEMSDPEEDVEMADDQEAAVVKRGSKNY